MLKIGRKKIKGWSIDIGAAPTYVKRGSEINDGARQKKGGATPPSLYGEENPDHPSIHHPSKNPFIIHPSSRSQVR